jgi:hypothetical protein
MSYDARQNGSARSSWSMKRAPCLTTWFGGQRGRGGRGSQLAAPRTKGATHPRRGGGPGRPGASLAGARGAHLAQHAGLAFVAL